MRTWARLCESHWNRKTTTFAMTRPRTAGVLEPPMTKGRVPPRSHLISCAPRRFRSRQGIPSRVRHGTEVELSVVTRLLVRAAQERVQLGGERNLPALHRPLRRRHHGIDAVLLEGAGRAPDEGRDVRGHELRSIEIASDPNRASGRERGADPRLAEVTDLQSEEELPRILALLLEEIPRGAVRPDGRVRVLEVAVVRVRAEVHPFPDEGVSQESVVLLVRVSLEYRLRPLPAHAADGTDGGAGSDLRPGAHDRALADRRGTFEVRERLDQRVLADDDGPSLRVQDGARHDARAARHVNRLRLDEVRAGIHGAEHRPRLEEISGILKDLARAPADEIGSAARQKGLHLGGNPHVLERPLGV